MFDGFSLTAKNRGIAIPVDLDSQVNQMFEKSNNVMNKAKVWINAKLNKRESIASVSRDYRNIIEGLQVIVDTFLEPSDKVMLLNRGPTGKGIIH